MGLALLVMSTRLRDDTRYGTRSRLPPGRPREYRDLLHQVVVESPVTQVVLGAPASSAPWSNLYDEMQLELIDVAVDTLADTLWMQLGDLPSKTWVPAGYQMSVMSERIAVFTSTTSKWAHNAWTAIFLCSPVGGWKLFNSTGVTPSRTLDSRLRISTGLRPRVWGESIYFCQGSLEVRTEVFAHRTSGNVEANSLRVVSNTGNIIAGKFSLYGVRR